MFLSNKMSVFDQNIAGISLDIKFFFQSEHSIFKKRINNDFNEQNKTWLSNFSKIHLNLVKINQNVLIHELCFKYMHKN